jgi:ribose 5-phosphate isomerase B
MIAIGSDHGGFGLKQEIMKYLEEEGIAFKDFGCYEMLRCDYPDVAEAVALSVVNGESDKGIVICGTGVAVSIVANKVPGIRCALCGDVYSAQFSRYHNDANMLALGGRVLGGGVAIEILDAWLNAKFDGGRHQARINKIYGIERKYAPVDRGED